MAIEIESFFAQTYDQARARFLDAARARGLAIERAVHPHALGPAGEPLSIDTACFLPDRPGVLLVLTSGIHGVEGSAAPAARSACCATTRCSHGWPPAGWRCCWSTRSTRTGSRICGG